jgi:hypothetical protein
VKTHVLKCRQPFYDAIVDGRKTFEVRKNDRGFAVGDVLQLHEIATHPPSPYHVGEWGETSHYTGRHVDVTVTYLTSDPEFVLPGFVVMGIRKVDQCPPHPGVKP